MCDVIHIPEPDFRCSGSVLPQGATEVWAFTSLKWGKAHFFKLEEGEYRSICGHLSIPTVRPNGQNTLSEPGTFSKCKVCMDRLRRA